MKKVLFVINTMGRAGAERALCSMLEIFKHDGVQVDLLSLVGRGELFADVPEYVNILNRKYSVASVMDKRGRLHLVFQVIASLFKHGYIFKNFRKLVRNYKKQRASGRVQLDKLSWHAIASGAPRLNEDYDLAVAYLEGGALYYVSENVKARNKAGFLHVDYSLTGYDSSFDRPYFESMDMVFCVSKWVKESFDREFPSVAGKSFVLHNTVLADEIITKSQAAQGFDDDFTGTRLLTIGRLHPQKAYDIAIEAMAQMKEKNIRWYVLGEGAERKELENLIERYGLKDKFILLGAKDNPYPYLRECDIYVQATHFEGWSIAVAEALVLKKYIIASNCAGNTEQIDNEKTGLIIDLSAENIVKAVERMQTDKELVEGFDRNLQNRRFDYRDDLNMLYEMI